MKMQIRDEYFRLISEHVVPKKDRVKVISCRTSGSKVMPKTVIRDLSGKAL